MKQIFAVYKPKGMTSHDVVDVVRKITGVKRVGHGGTLDPLASGVLIIAVGRENTKQLDQYVKGEKEYIATIKLGFESTTDDEEGEKTEYKVEGSRVKGQDSKPKILSPLPPSPFPLHPNSNDILNATQKFIGEFPQMPPIYSAKKVNGQTAYKMARRGKFIELTPKMVKIMNINLHSYKYPILTIRVTCGSGVFIRSLARDIGQELGVGGYLADLERIKVGEFKIEDAIKLDQLSNYF